MTNPTPLPELIERIESTKAAGSRAVFDDAFVATLCDLALEALSRKTEAPPPSPIREVGDWRCVDCGCHSFARCDERKPDGRFAPGPYVRCVSCKLVAYWPAGTPLIPSTDTAGVREGASHTLTSDRDASQSDGTALLPTDTKEPGNG